MSALVNLTPHPIILQENARRSVLPSEGCARVIQDRRFIGHADGWPVYLLLDQEVIGLPDPKPGTTYVVSAVVLNNLPPGRIDCVSPDKGYGSAVKDHKGNVVAVSGFVTKSGARS